MARRLRLHVPGGFHHVTLRGNHRQPIFFGAGDHDLLDRIVSRSLEQFSARIHAYCWMTNHLHMLVQVADAPLGRLILRIASNYARAVQLRLETTGHLFERRYHSVLVDADEYLLTLIRYIHLNPVRAGLAKDPADYPWSSHRVYLGLASRDWVTTEFTMRMLASQPAQRSNRYRALISSHEPLQWGCGRLVPHPGQPQILGNDAFVARVTSAEPRISSRRSLKDLLRECGERFQVTPESLTSASRMKRLVVARAWLAHEAVTGRVASICAVARRLGRCESAIRQLMSRYPRAELTR